MHDKGIAHRDLKPENMLMTSKAVRGHKTMARKHTSRRWRAAKVAGCKGGRRRIIRADGADAHGAGSLVRPLVPGVYGGSCCMVVCGACAPVGMWPALIERSRWLAAALAVRVLSDARAIAAAVLLYAVDPQHPLGPHGTLWNRTALLATMGPFTGPLQSPWDPTVPH